MVDGEPGLTLFACPKPFTDPHVALIQRNAITSWTLLRPRPEIILLGDEGGVAAICESLALRHIPVIARNEFGTPLLADLLRQGQQSARHDTVAYVNADIILLPDFLEAVHMVRERFRRFVLTGQRRTLPIERPLDFAEPSWASRLRERATREGTRDLAFDYFVFPRGFFGDIPPLALGRGWFDHWLIWRARAQRAALVDGTAVVTPVHQRHDYSHVVGRPEPRIEHVLLSEEGRRNVALVEWGACALTTKAATHRLTENGIRWHPSGTFHLYDPVGFLGRVLLRRTRKLRHWIGLRQSTLDRLLGRRPAG